MSNAQEIAGSIWVEDASAEVLEEADAMVVVCLLTPSWCLPLTNP
jgi:hypothetical protein